MTYQGFVTEANQKVFPVYFAEPRTFHCCQMAYEGISTWMDAKLIMWFPNYKKLFTQLNPIELI